MIDLQLEQSQIALSYPIVGEFTWQPDNPDKAPKSAEVFVAWMTAGRGSRDRQIVATQPIKPERLLKYRQRPFEFSLDIPNDAPLTYNGHLFRLMWEVKVQIVFPGLFRPKETTSQLIEVVAHHDG
ncbi:hypothetical protein [[Limnothrix rosea] IAM M-220]|uniref:hypothetical protein n=1 Tax=[Limnothrix rosea] IAM M-220 TaxID=454133 RepID=UPI000959E098|nr:hypothetical protein [[Limnothrix rosea] IAM M-220]OKH12917.1 hypothetical protein NIES208_15600 [[Limnothrix rosea] IAM M-220]